MGTTHRVRPTHRNQPDGSGRPPSPYGKKTTHSFYISEAANDSLQYLAGLYTDGNVSELLEMIARNKNSLALPEDDLHREFNNVPFFWRLRMVLREPAGIFWSLLAFADRFARQCGLEVDEDFLVDIFLRAMAALFYLDYLSPSQPPIDSLSAWLRWNLFHIIKARKVDSESATQFHQKQRTISKHDRYGNTTEEASAHQRLECIATIYQARCNLMQQAISSPMNALRLRVSHHYTLGQIETVCRAQGDAYTGKELLKYGIDAFRKLWLHQGAITTDIPDKTKEKLQRAFDYCKLLQQTSLSANQVEEFQDLIRGGIQYLDHDNWANEIDYFFTYVVFPQVPCIGTQKETVRQGIIQKFDSYFLERKFNIDRELAKSMPINHDNLNKQSKTTIFGFLNELLKEEIQSKEKMYFTNLKKYNFFS